MAHSIFTIGHSNRTLEDFETLLERYGIQLLIDVRTVPKSRHVPHFNTENLARALAQKKIDYRHMKILGGLRKPAKESVNLGWRNSGFRGFADHMQTEEFRTGVAELQRLAAKEKTAIMCAEAVPWRCHRSLIADALVVRQCQVHHILSPTSAQLHQLTPFAVVAGESITYPKR
ncbi:MAG TPA: DUF488 domain-containing protein [Candidatus Binatia bacterium]|jgi:uncharacterized protein (DUF488 family)